MSSQRSLEKRNKVRELKKKLSPAVSRADNMENRYSELKRLFETKVEQRTSALETRCLKLSQRNSVLEERVQKMETLFTKAKEALAENEQYRRLHGRLPSVISLVEELGMADRMAAVEASSVLGWR